MNTTASYLILRFTHGCSLEELRTSAVQCFSWCFLIHGHGKMFMKQDVKWCCSFVVSTAAPTTQQKTLEIIYLSLLCLFIKWPWIDSYFTKHRVTQHPFLLTHTHTDGSVYCNCKHTPPSCTHRGCMCRYWLVVSFGETGRWAATRGALIPPGTLSNHLPSSYETTPVSLLGEEQWGEFSVQF